MRHHDLAELDTRCKIVLQVEGQLQLKDPDPEKPEATRQADLKAKSTLDFFERSAYSKSQLVGSTRNYVVAEAENWVSGSASSFRLRPECQQTLMMRHEGVWSQYCERKPLTSREAELVSSPVNSAAVELLLPDSPAKPDSIWKIDADAAQSVFNLEAVHQSSLQARVTKVDDGVATISLDGKLVGTANSVSTRLTISGSLNVKLSESCALVTWLALSIQEKRDISQAEPGFDVTAQVRMIRAEKTGDFELTGNRLRELAEQQDEGRWLVRLQSTEGRYAMLCDRRWTTYLDSGEEAILRLIENDSVIAQCNISRLPKLDVGSQLTLEGLQAEIKDSLQGSFGQFLESNERLVSSKLRLIRCVVAGEAEEVPVQWIYNHFSDDSGRRMVMVYTMGGNVTDRFAAADEQMAASLEFLPETSSQQPHKAPQPERSATRAKSEASR